MIHPTVDLSPGHASIPRHQALVYIIMCCVCTLLPTNQLILRNGDLNATMFHCSLVGIDVWPFCVAIYINVD